MIFNNDRNTQFSGELPCFRYTLKKYFFFEVQSYYKKVKCGKI
ncbi:hypothetical protein M067_0109 [Bacteroides fragilis str. J-143-4]|nr:hypothetical protein M067_0109 [Bacteroides fragilis str. J-143-4]